VEGFWVGRSSLGADVALTVLENGETWGVYTSGGYIVGALAGSTSVTGRAMSGSGADFNLLNRTVSRGSFVGTFVPQQSISAQLSSGATFSGRYNSLYDQPASLSAAAGTYIGQGVTGWTSPQTIGVTVSSTGTITMPASLGCSASGTVLPRSSGKNVFNVSVRFQGTTCALGNGATAQGVAFYDAAQRTLLVLALNSAQTDGFIYYAAK